MREIVIISGKGGTGKTTITASLAAIVPSRVLADCDVDAADMHLVVQPEIEATHEFYSGELPEIDYDTCIQCGTCRDYCRFSAISEDIRIMKEHCEGCGLCYQVCPEGAIQMQSRLCGYWYESRTRFGPMVHAALGTGEENSGKLVTTVRQAAHNIAERGGYQNVLIDGSPGIGCPVIASLTNASLAVIVGEPTVSAIGDLKRVCELTKFFDIPSLSIINKSDINEELVSEIEHFCREKDIPIAGKLPYDPVFTRAQLQGKTVFEHDPQGQGKLVEEIWFNIETKLQTYMEVSEL